MPRTPRSPRTTAPTATARVLFIDDGKYVQAPDIKANATTRRNRTTFKAEYTVGPCRPDDMWLYVTIHRPDGTRVDVITDDVPATPEEIRGCAEVLAALADELDATLPTLLDERRALAASLERYGAKLDICEPAFAASK